MRALTRVAPAAALAAEQAADDRFGAVFDTVVIETTRGTTERPPGKERVNEIARLISSINDTIQRGGSYLIPVFALGRMQELFAILHDARKFGRLVDCPIVTGGLGVDLADYFDEIARKT